MVAAATPLVVVKMRRKGDRERVLERGFCCVVLFGRGR